MRVLMLSIDDRIFEAGSEVQERIQAYGGLFESLRVMVFTRRARLPERLGSVFLYPTPANFTPLALAGAIALGGRILGGLGGGNTVVTSQDAFATIVAFALRRRFGLPLQVQVHTDFLAPAFRRESVKNYLRFLIYRWSVRRAEGVRVVSERIRRGLVVTLGVPPEKIAILPIFVDVAKLAAPPDAAARQRYAGSRPVVLVVARLTREKNVGLAIDVFSRAAASLPQARLIVIGVGPERAMLEGRARSLGIAERIEFAGWQQDIAPYYRGADMLLVSSEYEGYGRMFVEAAAAGLPIVSTDVGIIGEVFKNGERALVFGTAAEGAHAIQRLSSDPALARRLAENARRAIVGLPDFKTYLDCYRSALERCRRRADAFS